MTQSCSTWCQTRAIKLSGHKRVEKYGAKTHIDLLQWSFIVSILLMSIIIIWKMLTWAINFEVPIGLISSFARPNRGGLRSFGVFKCCWLTRTFSTKNTSCFTISLPYLTMTSKILSLKLGLDLISIDQIQVEKELEEGNQIQKTMQVWRRLLEIIYVYQARPCHQKEEQQHSLIRHWT